MAKKHGTRVILSCLLALSLMLTACGTGGGGAATSPPASASATAPPASTTAAATATAAAPEPEAPRQISVAVPEETFIEDVKTNYASRFLEEMANVDIEWVIMPAGSAWRDKFEIMVTSNEQLPDVIFGNAPVAFVGKHAANGVFLDITPYYDEYSVYIKEMLESDPYAKSQVTFPDGKMYGVGRVQYQTHTEYTPKFFINQVWLDALNLPVPETYDQLVDTLRAFRDKDPNGNGKKDEVPLTGYTTPSEPVLPFTFLMGSFVFVNGAHYLLDEGGKLVPAFTSEGWREGLRAFNALYAEGGIIDPLMFTQDQTQYRSLCQNEEIPLVGAVSVMNTTGPFQTDYERANMYVGTAPFIGPSGAQYAAYSPPSVSLYAMMSKDARDPVAAFQFLDATWSLEGSMVTRYGEQGVDWDWLPEGTHGRYTDNLGVPAAFTLMSTVQSDPNNQWWAFGGPMYIPYSIGDGWPDLEPTDAARPATDCLGLLVGHIPDTVVGRLIFTPEESNEINEILTNINTYRNEALSLFVLGDMDPEKDWDAYVQEMDNIGLQKYLEVAQRAYDRSK